MRDDDLFESGDPFAGPAWKEAKKAPKTAKPRSKWRRECVRVPWKWVERLQSTKRVSTWRLAMLLLYEYWHIQLPKKKGRATTSNSRDEICLSNILAQDVGLSRRSKSRSLDELEDFDLLDVKRRPQTSPRVLLKDLEEG
jgi:hypothetical protein